MCCKLFNGDNIGVHIQYIDGVRAIRARRPLAGSLAAFAGVVRRSQTRRQRRAIRASAVNQAAYSGVGSGSMMNDNTKSIRTFAEAELQRMNIQYITLTLIRDKDGISVWRFTTDDTSYVMKCFEKPEHRREISNYQILQSIGVPTLKVIAHTDYSVIIEDIEHSIYRGIAHCK